MNPFPPTLRPASWTPAIRMGLSIAVATGLYGISFGALAVAAGLTVWQAMAQRDERYLLQGRVEIDDAYLGGERAGHINGGRRAANKTAFIAAVQTSADGRPLYMRLTPVADFTNEHMRQWASRHLAAGCHACLCPGAACPGHA